MNEPLTLSSMAYATHEKGYWLSTDKHQLNLDFIHQFLRITHWATNIPREVVERAIANSLCFGLFQNETQVGFARVVTDYATFAYVADVFISEPHRGLGLSRWMIRQILVHPDLQGLRKITLHTSKAHDIYRDVGFAPISTPNNWMEIHIPDIYSREQEPTA